MAQLHERYLELASGLIAAAPERSPERDPVRIPPECDHSRPAAPRRRAQPLRAFPASRQSAYDHVQAVAMLFDLVDLFSRTDTRAELLNRSSASAARSQPFATAPACRALLKDTVEIYSNHEKLSGANHNPGQAVRENEWLMSVRSRILIAGSAADYDMPSFWAWQNNPARSADAQLQGVDDAVRPADERVASRPAPAPGKCDRCRSRPPMAAASIRWAASRSRWRSCAWTRRWVRCPRSAPASTLLWIRFNHFDRRTRPRPIERSIALSTHAVQSLTKV
ncbi:MAG: cell division protein ZapD [Burkholderiaceae bacterium]